MTEEGTERERSRKRINKYEEQGQARRKVFVIGVKKDVYTVWEEADIV